jgi:curli production assembly/transport component CsgG
VAHHSLKLALAGAAFIGLAACVSPPQMLSDMTASNAESGEATAAQNRLLTLPAPRERIAITVYNFEDQTGQFKASDTAQSLSRAVSQGSTSILIKALQDAGNRSWFTVVERAGLDNLLKERQIIREMRKQYLGEDAIDPAALPPMLFAGIILEGGVIGYDTNTVTGGAGARFLGIGGATQYREDKVTVYLRAVSVKTGEVVTSVVATKKIASVSVAANVFRYVGFKELLEVDTGVTTNEPDLLALRQAIEKAVELLVMEGADLGVWTFADQGAGDERLAQFRQERDGVYPAGSEGASQLMTASAADTPPASPVTKDTKPASEPRPARRR